MVFTRAYIELATRIKIFASLGLDDLDRLALQRRVDDIGRTLRASEKTG